MEEINRIYSWNDTCQFDVLLKNKQIKTTFIDQKQTLTLNNIV